MFPHDRYPDRFAIGFDCRLELHRAEHHCVRLFLSPDLQAALQRAQELIGILPRTLRRRTLPQFAARPPGLFVNHACSSLATRAKGSGRRRPRFCFGLACAVGRISPAFQAVRGPDRNRSRDGSAPQPMACRTCRRCRRGAAAPSASRSATGLGPAAHMFARVQREPLRHPRIYQQIR